MLGIIKEECVNLTKQLDFSSFKDKKILITGASGMVGVYLIGCLKEVRVKYNIKIFCWVNSHIDEIFNELYEDCFIIKGDITDKKVFDSIFSIGKFDFIVHAAGYAQPNKFLENKIKTIQLNTNSTINLFEILSLNGTFVFISTSELYSGLNFENIKEDQIGSSSPSHSRSCYIEGKRCGEAICNAYRERGYNVKIVRLSLAYGPGTKANDQRVLNSLFQKALEKKEINLLDSGSSIRTYGYISDICEMIWNITISGKHNVYNVAGNSITTIKELAYKIGSLTDSKVKVPNDDSGGLAGNPMLVNISLERYIAEFHKNEFVSLEDGLRRTLLWQKNLYSR